MQRLSDEIMANRPHLVKKKKMFNQDNASQFKHLLLRFAKSMSKISNSLLTHPIR